RDSLRSAWYSIAPLGSPISVAISDVRSGPVLSRNKATIFSGSDGGRGAIVVGRRASRPDASIACCSSVSAVARAASAWRSRIKPCSTVDEIPSTSARHCATRSTRGLKSVKGSLLDGAGAAGGAVQADDRAAERARFDDKRARRG